ncbi:MAG: hypothetical protein R3F62_29965 [Planctomycetota bacterium]
MLRFAYNTNGLQSHRLADALELLSETGYHGVALTLDHMHLDPLEVTPQQVQAVARPAPAATELHDRDRRYGRPAAHRPTLIDPELERMRRVDLLRRSLDLAAELGARRR